MIQVLKNLRDYRELIQVLAWKGIIVRYKQAYLGIAWAVLKPVLLMLIFSLVKSFVGIDTGEIPYPIMAFAALLPWVFFQEGTSDSVNSVTANAALIRKIYFPREIFPITALLTKIVELAISFLILAGLMVYYQMVPSIYALWVPLIILYTVVTSLVVGLIGAALNVYYRDFATALPVALSLLMYASPIIYPLSLVERTLLTEQAAGDWSSTLFFVYTLNPLAGIIDAFQRAVLKGLPPDFSVIWPGMMIVMILLPLSYRLFKRAERHFADVI